MASNSRIKTQLAKDATLIAYQNFRDKKLIPVAGIVIDFLENKNDSCIILPNFPI